MQASGRVITVPTLMDVAGFALLIMFFVTCNFVSNHVGFLERRRRQLQFASTSRVVGFVVQETADSFRDLRYRIMEHTERSDTSKYGF